MVNSARTAAMVAITLLLGLVVLCGCQHQYIIRLKNGEQILSQSKPRLEGTNYYYSAGAGATFMVPRNHVVSVRAASLKKVQEEPAPPNSSPKPAKPKHWYFLWLA